MIARTDGRLGEPMATSATLDHLCPICEGEGDPCAMHCLCEGLGVITADLAYQIAADDPDPRWAPRPLDPVPAYCGRRCGDCAFKPASLERDGKTAGELFEHLASANGALGEQPFYCHAGMHHGAKGYVPRQRDEYGAPIGHPICAGWVREYERRASEAKR
jgi:hypothetical protein